MKQLQIFIFGKWRTVFYIYSGRGFDHIGAYRYWRRGYVRWYWPPNHEKADSRPRKKGQLC